MKDMQRRREELGWSRAELARRAGINPSTVSQIESGRFNPYPAQLAKLAGALKVPASRKHHLLKEVDSA